ncbi:hypothetical protein ACP6PL_22450 [Dapis sp. BLCC M126]|uniref:hypothetical protein n=1 Tax=Dapis sp. BLCC M126 TaxID=3400189 RepID=UPI003CED37A9
MPDDIHQVVAYATYKKCHEAILIYPHKLTNPINQLVGDSEVRLRSLTFALDSDLEKAGQSFFKRINPAILRQFVKYSKVFSGHQVPTPNSHTFF